MTTEWMLETEGLVKQYGPLVALAPLSLRVPPGQVVALVGPNGAGKTTALKLMAGLLSPTRGRVLIGGFDVQRQPLDAKRLLSFIPDQPFLYEQLTVAEFLGFVGAIYQMDPTTLARQAEALAATFASASWLGMRIGQLSYGMRSRVMLIAGLLHEPRLLLMDEPFFGLDPQTLRLVKRLLVERARQGMTVILSTHQLSIVEDVADQIAVLARGQVMALGSLEELIRQHGGERLEELFFRLTDSTLTP